MARIEVPMPQMGESIAEGTVSQWLKQLGDKVERDEPILEISTDKVDAEIPSPSDGTLVEIAVQEGETVEVGTIVAYIDTEGGPAGVAAPTVESEVDAAAEVPQEPGSESVEVALEASDDHASAEERLRTRSTPVVRKIAEEHGVNIQDVSGTGHAGRVTKQDILDFIEHGLASSGLAQPVPVPVPTSSDSSSAPSAAKAPRADSSDLWTTFYREVQHPEFPVRSADTVEPMDKIRRLTAEHMVIAKRVAPHVHSFIEIDFSAIDFIRAESKERWASQGARVSYTAFVAWAVSRVLREFPTVNSTISGNNVIYRGNVNLGMAVDLNPGLIVPVVHDADHPPKPQSSLDSGRGPNRI